MTHLLTRNCLAVLVVVCVYYPAFASGNDGPEFSKLEAGKTSPVAAERRPLRPFANGLGQEFVPVPALRVFFCRWETRVRDFRAFVGDRRWVDPAIGRPYDYGSEEFGRPMFTLTRQGWKQAGGTWAKPGFAQSEENCVVGVSWLDASAFCRWLTNRERAGERLPSGWEYRLPTDAEWSAAVGSALYPWENDNYIPSGAGNYTGDEARDGNFPDNFGTIRGYWDGYARTAPVASFKPNQYGICDLGGNATEWCLDWYRKEMNSEFTKEIDAGKFDKDNKKFYRETLLSIINNDGDGEKYRTVRGGSWFTVGRGCTRSYYRSAALPGDRSSQGGFRVVCAPSAQIVADGSIPPPQALAGARGVDR